MRTSRTAFVQLLILVCVPVLATGCGGVRSKEGVYTSVGRVVEKSDETVSIRAPAPRPPPGLGVTELLALEIAVAVTPRIYHYSFQRYVVVLETGERLTFRSRVNHIEVGDCARVWVDAPSVDAIYLYTPDMSTLDKTDECKE
jgi:hypothetical protein